MSRVGHETPRPRSEAAEATRGSAIKLAAEVSSRAFTFATTALLARRLGVEEYGAYARLSVLAVLLAELAEVGLQATATRALVAGTHSLRALVRARLAAFSALVAVALVALPLRASWPSRLQPAGVLVVLVLFFALSGWGEFLGVALRCRGARVEEARLLLCLRASGLALAAAALAAHAGLSGVAWALALSPVPALVLGVRNLRRRPPAHSGPDVGVGAVLWTAAPLAVYGGMLLLSPRVEFLVVLLVRGDRENGLFGAALTVFWFLGMVPAAVAAGAMPALTREALRGEGPVRRSAAGTLALLASPVAVGLALVAPALVERLFGPDYAPAAAWLRLLAVGLLPLFMNALVAWSLIAAGRASLLPRLTATRVALAFALAFVLVPRLGAAGAAAGLVLSESVLLLLGVRACARAGFPVPVLRPAGLALAATLPMALAVHGVGPGFVVPVAMGALTYAATLAASWRLLPGLAREMTGDLRYP
jgi:O-antigen/teichoic acid export membrane protein